LQQHHGDQRGRQLRDTRNFRLLPEFARGQKSKCKQAQHGAPPLLIKRSQRIFMAVMQKGKNPHQSDQDQTDVSPRNTRNIGQPDRLQLII
jgi:hypothetical protein